MTHTKKTYLFLLFCILLISHTHSAIQTSNVASTQNIETAEIYLEKSTGFINTSLDSALYYAYKYEALLDKLPEDYKKYKYYRNLGYIYAMRGNYSSSLEYALKTQSIIENLLTTAPDNQEYTVARADVLIQLGSAYYQQKNYNQALGYFNEALLYLEEKKIEDIDTDLNLKLKVLNNTAGIFIRKEEFDKALEFYNQALKLNSELNDKRTEATLLNNIGICYLEKQDYVLSLYFFEQALKIRQELNDLRGVAQCYNNIGKNYALNENYSRAKEYFQEALSLGHQIGNPESILNSLQSLMTLYDKTGNYKDAYQKQSELTQLRDSLFNAETIKRIAQIEVNHQFEKQKELYELELKSKEVEQEKAELKYYIIAISLFFLLAIAALLNFLQKSKLRNLKLSKDKLELEHKNISLEKERLQEELAFKRRELTTKMMYLLKKNELIHSISDKLIALKKNVKDTNQKPIQEMIVEMRSKKDDDIWPEFETHFTAVHPHFYKKLQELHPKLTPNEKKLCAFLRLNMTTKDISAITYQSVNSITVSRTRLRKKLNISGEDTNLTNTLMNL